jgi:hypothetical protein
MSYVNQIQGETFTSLNQTGDGFLIELKGEGIPHGYVWTPRKLFNVSKQMFVVAVVAFIKSNLNNPAKTSSPPMFPAR